MTVRTEPVVVARIEAALDRFFAERASAVASLNAGFADLWDLAATHARGGKLVRPRLFIDAVEAFCTAEESGDTRGSEGVRKSGRIGEESVDRLAAVLEVLHYAFLLHDDVIDGDLVRRHGPNLIGTVRGQHPDAPDGDSLHWGTSAAILMGDVLLSAAVLDCARLPLPSGPRARVLDLVDEAITETVAGEYLDVGLSDGVVAAELDTVMTMTALKTASYSFSLPLRLAAALSDAAPEVDETLVRVGNHLGVAFQVQDDLLTMFGRHVAHGKDALSDLREGKQTVLVAHLRSSVRWHEIAGVLGEPDVDESGAARIRRAFDESGSRTFAVGLVTHHLAEAARVIGSSTVPLEVRRVVEDCVESLKSRSI
ncbi:polyprenyl synthetase family protein [Brevibacterium yomogidense]|uniref:polyprenyl synthetase family protein n=1 Tax=Brevibacterium yomogidense TaxID=946573 RepID=UPI0018DFA5FA|nr:polyprenyl synthetase family protein [Brevibacterium yomogidense]